MQRRHFVLSLIAVAVLAPTALLAADSGAPTEAIVRTLVNQIYNPGTTAPAPGLAISKIEIGAGHKASAREGMDYQVSLNQMIYPLHVAYTNTSGSGPGAYVRIYDTHYFVFKSAQKNGAWDLTGDPKPGDKNGVLKDGCGVGKDC